MISKEGTAQKLDFIRFVAVDNYFASHYLFTNKGRFPTQKFKKLESLGIYRECPIYNKAFLLSEFTMKE